MIFYGGSDTSGSEGDDGYTCTCSIGGGGRAAEVLVMVVTEVVV